MNLHGILCASSRACPVRLWRKMCGSASSECPPCPSVRPWQPVSTVFKWTVAAGVSSEGPSSKNSCTAAASSSSSYDSDARQRFGCGNQATRGEDPTADPRGFYLVQEPKARQTAGSPRGSSAGGALIVIQTVRRHRSTPSGSVTQI